MQRDNIYIITRKRQCPVLITISFCVSYFQQYDIECTNDWGVKMSGLSSKFGQTNVNSKLKALRVGFKFEI